MESNCIQWRGRKNKTGYGVVLINGKQHFAHRLAVALSGRNIPKHKVCDHLCRNHACVNPAHIELVTIKENVMRGTSPIAHMGERDRCKNGHEFTPQNTRIFTPKGKKSYRHCKRCYADRELQRRRRLGITSDRKRHKYGE